MNNQQRFWPLWCLVFSFSSFAAAPVGEIGERAPETAGVAQPSAAALSSIPVSTTPPPPLEEPVDSYTKLQLLQDEVMQLRGMVEELSNEVRQLKQQQMDDYMDLDRRLSSAVTTVPSGSNATVTTPVGQQPATSSSVPAASDSDNEEVKSYNNAYNLLKGGQVDQAVAAFKKHIETYPAGSYTANSHYWLGEIYLLKNNLEEARQSFTTVSESYPAHRKASDATYSLGKVYHLLGNAEKAKALLQQVADGSSSAAPKAKKYLSDNF